MRDGIANLVSGLEHIWDVLTAPIKWMWHKLEKL